MASAQIDQEYKRQTQQKQSDYNWCIQAWKKAPFRSYSEYLSKWGDDITRYVILNNGRIYRMQSWSYEDRVTCRLYFMGYINKQFRIPNEFWTLLYKAEGNMLIKYEQSPEAGKVRRTELAIKR